MWSFLQSLSQKNCALLSIDLQYMSVDQSLGALSQLTHEAYQQFSDQLTQVLSHVKEVQTLCRQHHIELIHIRIQSLTQDGRDRSVSHKRLHLHAAPGSQHAQFLPQATPQQDEIIINKTASGVFSSTNLTYILNNLDIDTLIIIGAYSNECISNAVRVACDEGYQVIVIEDACIAVTLDLHIQSMNIFHQRYAQVITTQDLHTHLSNDQSQNSRLV